MKPSWYRITVSDTDFLGIGAQIEDAYIARRSAVVAAGWEKVAVFQSSQPWETGDFFSSPRTIEGFSKSDSGHTEV